MVRIWLRPRPGRWRDDRGITTLQVLIMLPVMVVVMFMAIQEALNYYAQEVAMGAAEQGAEVARITGDPGKGVAAAIEYVQHRGGAFLPGTITIDTTGTTPTEIHIRVSGQPVTVIGALASTVTVDQVAKGPVERFTYNGSPP